MMKFNFLLLSVLLSFCLEAFATTNQTPQLDASKLNAEKDYLSAINQCSNTQLFSKVIDQALKTKDEAKRTVFAAQIEETIINNPSCFVAAVTKMGYQKCEVVEENFVREPYFYPRYELYRALSSASNFGGSCFAS
jgi:hypothetical protein